MIICKDVQGTGTIEAKGGAGSGSGTVFGGGGGGGIIYVVTHLWTGSVTMNVNGGSGWGTGKPGAIYKILV